MGFEDGSQMGSESIEMSIDALEKEDVETKRDWKDYLRYLPHLILLIGFHVYLVFAIIHDFGKCAWLVTATVLVWTYFLYEKILIPKTGFSISGATAPVVASLSTLCTFPFLKIVATFLVIAGILTFIIIDTWHSRIRLTGLAGIVIFITFMILFSKDRSKIKWQTVIMGFTLHFLIGLLLLRWSWGAQQMRKLSDLFVGFLDFTTEGTKFVYGFLADPPNICGMNPVLAFTAFQVLLFFSAVVALLYYYNVIQFVLGKVAWLMQHTLGTTAPESFYASTCIFVGMSESIFLIRPYYEKMTESEIFATITSGFACVAGSLFSAYAQLGACPVHLITSSIMSAPCSIACSKLLFPETEESQVASFEDLELPPSEESNAIECISNGAMSAIHVIAAIVANLIVFLALLAFIDSSISYLGTLVGLEHISLDLLLSYLFFPVAYVMGVTDVSQTLLVSQLLGIKTASNEFIAYQKMGEMIDSNKISDRATLISTYALCSFSNFSSIGSQVGTLSTLCPSRKQTFARLAPRALLAASIASFYTATVAGILVENPQNCQPSLSQQCVSINDLRKLISNSSNNTII